MNLKEPEIADLHTEQKEKAIEFMEKIDIFKPYIDGFRKNDKVCFFENYGGFWVDQEPEIKSKMKELEERYRCIVYAVTHEFTDFGECYDFLIVTEYPEEWSELVCSNGNCYYTFAYVWNKTDDECSEFGTIAVQSFGGGIRRIG